MDLARAPRRTVRKKGSGYENGLRADAVLTVGVAHARHRIKTHRRSTQPKKRNRCHAMIRNDS